MGTNDSFPDQSLSNLPLVPKVIFTGIVVCNILLLLAGQLYISFSVYWGSSGLGGVAFQYSMWEGICQLYKEKIYGISILLTIWSGIWPHVKLLTMLVFCWVPEGLIPNQVAVLRWFTFFGKFSFVDVWVVVSIIVALRINASTLPALDAALWVQAVGEEGVFYFCEAVILSQALGQVFTHHLTGKISTESNTLEGLLPPSFLSLLKSSRLETVRAGRVCMSSAVADSMASAQRLLISVSLVVLSLCIVAGLFIPSFRVTYTSAGVIFATTDYSLFGGLLTAASPNHVGRCNAVLSAIGLLLVVAMPLAQILLVCLLWFRDNAIAHAENMFAVLSVLRYWAGVDPFVLALLVVASELSQLLDGSPLGKFVHVSMVPLSTLYALGACSVLAGLLLWLCDFDHHMRCALRLHPRGIAVPGQAHYEPLLLETGSNASIDV